MKSNQVEFPLQVLDGGTGRHAFEVFAVEDEQEQHCAAFFCGPIFHGSSASVLIWCIESKKL
jgi:hypothetical protein